MRLVRHIIIFAIMFPAFQPATAQDQTLRLLFVGNSLTYTNDLPQLVEKAAGKKGLEVKARMIAYPNYALIDHWNDGAIQEEIAGGKYDLVIVQQGPSSQAEGRRLLLEYGERFQVLCEEHDAQLAYFMVWPSRTYYHTFDGVIANHREAAELHGALLLPVGESWKARFDSTGNFDYYGPDGFHPSIKGSKAAAVVIAKQLMILWKASE